MRLWAQLVAQTEVKLLGFRTDWLPPKWADFKWQVTLTRVKSMRQAFGRCYFMACQKETESQTDGDPDKQADTHSCVQLAVRTFGVPFFMATLGTLSIGKTKRAPRHRDCHIFLCCSVNHFQSLTQDWLTIMSSSLDKYILTLQLLLLVVFLYCFVLMFYLQLITFKMQHRLRKEIEHIQPTERHPGIGKSLSNVYVKLV